MYRDLQVHTRICVSHRLPDWFRYYISSNVHYDYLPFQSHNVITLLHIFQMLIMFIYLYNQTTLISATLKLINICKRNLWSLCNTYVISSACKFRQVINRSIYKITSIYGWYTTSTIITYVKIWLWWNNLWLCVERKGK